MNKTCPSCTQPLPPDAPGGLCPQCLLARGFKTDPNKTSDYVPFEPPSVADVAALFPQLDILELLGAGGMGAVYKARQPALDRVVALKILPKRDDPAFSERFTREARALAKLSHPGIVTVHDFGQAGELFYFVMEYVDGVNLRQAEKAGKLTPAEALAIVPQICAALQFAHDAGVVHRDIKPENILLDAKGRVKIADFGLAKLSGAAGPNPLTHTHQVMGTMHYMAPEQWEKPNEVDHRADIYSLGVVFYELLTGELPLGRFPLPSERVQVDVRLDDIVLRTLQKQPERRYQHASEVKTAVENVQAAPAMPPPAAPRKRSIGWVALIVACVLMVLMCAGITSLIFFPSFDVVVDVKTPRELIIGSWTWLDGRVGTTEFRADGTFEERFRQTVPDVKVGELVDLENQKMIERDGKLVGQYSWATHDVIWVESQGRAPRQVTVVVTEKELTLKENDGGVHRMERLSPAAANAKTPTQQSLIGKWKSTTGDLGYEFLPNSTFFHTARVKVDPQLPEVEMRMTCRYRWQDEQLIEFRPADSGEGKLLELHFAKEGKTWLAKGPRLRLKFVPERDGFVVLADHDEVVARLKRDQAKASDTNSLREQLIGTWDWAIQTRSGRTTFRADGTFEERSRSTDMLDGRDTIEDGQYRWLGPTRIEIKSPRQGTHELQLQFADDKLTALRNDGGVTRMRRVPPETLARQAQLLGVWTDQKVQMEFLADGSFSERHAWIRQEDPTKQEQHYWEMGQYSWTRDDQLTLRERGGDRIWNVTFENKQMTIVDEDGKSKVFKRNESGKFDLP